MENPGCVTFRDPLVFSSQGDPRRADPARHARSPTRWRTSGSATSSPRSGGTTCGSTSPSPSTWATGSPPTSPSTTTPGPTTPTPAASGAWSPTSGRARTRWPATARSTRARRCRTSTASPTPRARASSSSSTRTLGDEVFFAGAIDHFTRHRFGNATMHDLFASWERAGAGDLSAFTDNWLRTAGPDTIVLDRAAGVVRRTPPADHPADRAHAFRVASAAPGGAWEVAPLTRGRRRRRRTTRATGAAVLLDPYEDTCALVQPDADHGRRRSRRCCRPPTTPCCGPASGTTCAAPSTTPRSTPPTCSTCSRPACRSRTATTRSSTRCPGCSAKVVPLSADPAAALRRRPRGRLRQGRVAPRPGSTLQLAALQAAISSAHGLRRAAHLAGRAGCCPTASSSTSTCAGGSWCSWRCSARPTASELDAALAAEPTARSRVEHAAGHGVAARRRGQGVGLAAVHRRGRRAQLRARGHRRGHVAARPGAPDRAVRRRATSTSCPAPSQARSGWLLADAAEAFFPITALDRGDPRAGARR